MCGVVSAATAYPDMIGYWLHENVAAINPYLSVRWKWMNDNGVVVIVVAVVIVVIDVEVVVLGTTSCFTVYYHDITYFHVLYI